MSPLKDKKYDKNKLIRKIRLQEEQISEMRIYIETLKQMVRERESSSALQVNTYKWNAPEVY